MSTHKRAGLASQTAPERNVEETVPGPSSFLLLPHMFPLVSSVTLLAAAILDHLISTM